MQVVLQASSAVLGAVENQVSVSAVEPSVQTLRNRNQLHVLHSPHLEPRPLTRTLELQMEHHDVTCRDIRLWRKQGNVSPVRVTHLQHKTSLIQLREAGRDSLNKQ